MKNPGSKQAVLGLCAFWLWSSQPVSAQGLGEFAGINAGVAGLGAGLAAIDKGRMLKQGAAFVQQSAATQTKAINDCMQLDKQYEMKKMWAQAEECLNTALKYVASRDGPGSAKSVPVLSRLVKVSEEQNKIKQAIGYQKTVLVFNKAGKVTNPDITHESLVLSNLYVKDSDFQLAEPVLRESIALEKPKPVKSTDYKKSLRVFGKVLRENKKVEEAATVESELVSIEGPPGENSAARSEAPLDSAAAAAGDPAALTPPAGIPVPLTPTEPANAAAAAAPTPAPAVVGTDAATSATATSASSTAAAAQTSPAASSTVGMPDGVPITLPATSPENTPIPAAAPVITPPAEPTADSAPPTESNKTAPPAQPAPQ